MQEHTISPPFWNLDQVPFATIDLAQARAQEDLFYLTAAASFVEIATDLYADNLIQYFSGSDDVVDWLQNTWKNEEVRHGRVLREYVRHVWPEFDWEHAYADFFADYSRRCTVDALESTRSLEMVARCVVETGTATFYQALATQASEPILSGIAAHIRADEINHYKHFYGYFGMYSASESPRRLQILGALKRRVLEARNDDADCALWHVFIASQTQKSTDKAAFRALRARLREQTRQHYPVAMTAKMLLKPLHLPGAVTRLIHPSLTWIARRLM
ncbi:ferritin-like domain-containing protein [Paralcaligenes sp. KSB-10]|uniref:ferritin-like domain-containing protein n=1 Tax=Paralcaligenes sp. KSB-10 TaxID=2901142 RepID=UPI001E5706F3|nr:ferritin-like domain-containing protein [Paralcaligenes sp. KSB-10]UHL64570.1 ferritin-like domain-containing protein [Paralcaligenes sp. KSB-10]